MFSKPHDPQCSATDAPNTLTAVRTIELARIEALSQEPWVDEMRLKVDKAACRPPYHETVFKPLQPAPAREVCIPYTTSELHRLMSSGGDDDEPKGAKRTDAMRNFIVFHFTGQPTAALNAYQHALTGTGLVQTTVESADHKFTYTLSFNVEGELAKRTVSVSDYTCTHKMAQNDAATRALNIIDAVRMRLDTTEYLAKYDVDSTPYASRPRRWYTNYYTMRSYNGMPWTVEKRDITTNSEVRTRIKFAYWREDDDGCNASLVERSVTGLGATSDDSLDDAMLRAMMTIAFDGRTKNGSDKPAAATPGDCAENKDKSVASDEPQVDAEPAATAPGEIAYPECTTDTDKSKNKDAGADNPKVRAERLRAFRVTATDPLYALREYHGALSATPGYDLSMVESAEHTFSCGITFKVETATEGETRSRNVCVSDYKTRQDARDAAAIQALNIIDAVRMNKHANECMAKCAHIYPPVSPIPLQWYSNYRTMRGWAPTWIHGERNTALLAAVATDIKFKYWHINDDENDATVVEHTVPCVDDTYATALNDAMWLAVAFIAFHAHKDLSGKPAAATAASVVECAAAAPKEFESTASNVQRLHALCCALDPVKDSKLRPSYSAFESEIAGKIGVYATLPAPDGVFTYQSPHILVGNGCDAVYEAKEMAAHYMLCWIGVRIFGAGDTHSIISPAIPSLPK
jgi:hypothetical protein